MLFVDDLVEAYQMAIKAIETTSGKIYNLGGGPGNKMCLHDLIHNPRRADETKAAIRLRRLASRRSAGLRLQCRQGKTGLRLGAAHLTRRGRDKAL